ncbi:Nn.00g096940.m01.CDS01 [Neocucurbitaria sp. VM-36]
MSTRGAEGTEAESRDNSPEGQEGSSEKRAMCGRCQKTGRADQCTYDPRLLEESHVTSGARIDEGGASFSMGEDRPHELGPFHSAPDELRWKVRHQERRIEILEQKLAANNRQMNPSHYQDRRPEEPEFNEEMMFRGKGFKTQFHGATSVLSLISQYRELQAFTREALTVDHSITHVRTDFKAFRQRRKMASNQKDVGLQGTNEEILAALPERNIVDVHIALYFQMWETTYRVLHEPSFWSEYSKFWEEPGDARQISFAVILLLIVAATKCLNPKDDIFVGDTTADRQAASNLIEICDSWISRQPRKRMTLLFFQLRCLALLAKRANCVKLKQDWVTSGDLVRLALASGMHRDPSMLASGKISEFEKEMKKRLWVTIMELELQSSLESGLQSSLTGLYFDTSPPANLPDEAFSVDSDEIPASRPVEYFTSASYLSVALKSLSLRIYLAQLLNDPSTDLQYSDILRYDAQIHSMLSALPKWEDDRAMVPSALLQVQLRQYLLMLHKPYAKLVAKNQRYMYSFTTCVDVASSIIATHDNLISKGSLTLNNFRNDVVRVGLSLSQIVYHNCAHYGPIKTPLPPANSNETHFADQSIRSGNIPKGWGLPDIPLMLTTLPQEPFLARTLCASSVEVLDRSRQIFEHKVMRLGTGYMEFWLLCAAVGMLPSAPSPATSIAYVTNASDDIRSRCKMVLDRFTNLTFRVLALQKDPRNSFAISLRDTMASVSPSDARTPSLALGAGSGIGATPTATGHAIFSAMPGMDMGTGVADGPKDVTGPFDALQDMQVDLGGWSFPDFWAFDLGGDF